MRVRSYLVSTALLSAVMLVSLLLSLDCEAKSNPPQPAEQPVKLGGTFDTLVPEQQHFVRDWYQQFNEIMGEDLDPKVAYGELPYSTRTTFEAVTNALMNTELTDVTGKSLGTAADLMRLIETVRGQVLKAKGDVQFRIYAMLTDNAVDVLDRSIEFKRGRDNTHYHVDYPVNYRLDGTPSLQFSISEDGQRADIDVDYRSSKFPVLFFDGHLRSWNSDVRAKDNYQRHVGRWQGFVNWWRNLFGLDILSNGASDTLEEAKPLFPPNPRVSDHEDLAVAVEDFLSSWLVGQKPTETLAYFAESSYPCILDLEPDVATTEMAPFRILRDMKEVNRLLGKVERIGDAVEAVAQKGSFMKPVDNPHAEQFSLYRILPELVKDMECRYTSETIALHHKESSKDYFGATMKLKSMHGGERDLFQIWTKQEGYWKVVAFHTHAFRDAAAVPDSRSNGGRKEPPKPRRPVVVDPSLVSSIENFMSTWFIQNDLDAALGYFSEKSYDCVGLFNDASQPPTNHAEGRTRLKQDLKKISDFAEATSSLEQALQVAEPWEPDIHLITHEQQDAYALTSYSDYHAEQLDCRHRRERREYHGERPRNHGRYYAASFHLRKQSGDQPPIITLVWAEQKKDWKIVSFDIEVH